jgi:hypothetical protein
VAVVLVLVIPSAACSTSPDAVSSAETNLVDPGHGFESVADGARVAWWVWDDAACHDVVSSTDGAPLPEAPVGETPPDPRAPSSCAHHCCSCASTGDGYVASGIIDGRCVDAATACERALRASERFEGHTLCAPK